MAKVFGHEVEEEITSVEGLRKKVGAPSELVVNKVIDHVDDLSERFIAASSLVFVATQQPNGAIDVTPRGDPAGFVHVLDRHTLAMPDRPGNRRMDTFENVLRTGQVGLIFVIAGHRHTLRVFGTAKLVRDRALGERMAVNGKPAELILLIRVAQVMSHCPKAFIRGSVWSPEKWLDAAEVPTLAEIVHAHAQVDETVEEIDDRIEESARERLY